MPHCFDVAVVGGGAAGLVAAISAARRGGAVVVGDRMPRLGKKILITGGGRCNLLNEDLSARSFTSTSGDLVTSILGRFGKEDIRDFFLSLGLGMYSEGSRVFPITNQASSVLRVLEMEIRRLGVAVELNFEASRIERAGPLYSIAAADGRKLDARSVILAGGGKGYPALGSNGSCYELARKLGHGIVPPVPSAVPLIVRDKMCHLLQGQKVRTRAAARIGPETSETADGEVLFAPYGLSGTAVLDVSESLSVAINRYGKTDASIVLDLVPFLTREALAAEFLKRMKAGWAESDLAAGLLPDKFAALIPGMLPPARERLESAAAALAAVLKEKIFRVQGTRSWNEAEFTCGGVDAREIDPRTLESRFRERIYFAGEILDVQGRRGGHNLAWAWASGFIAGLLE